MSYCFKITILAELCDIFIEKLQKSLSAEGGLLVSGGWGQSEIVDLFFMLSL